MHSDYFFHTVLALWAVAVGAFLCAVYDVFRVLRLRRKQNRVVLFFLDLLFCLIATLCLLILFFNLSYGRVRVYALALAFVGFLIWRFTVSRAVIAVCLKFIAFSEKVFGSAKKRICSFCKRMLRYIYLLLLP